MELSESLVQPFVMVDQPLDCPLRQGEHMRFFGHRTPPYKNSGMNQVIVPSASCFSTEIMIPAPGRRRSVMSTANQARQEPKAMSASLLSHGASKAILSAAPIPRARSV